MGSWWRWRSSGAGGKVVNEGTETKRDKGRKGVVEGVEVKIQERRVLL